MIQFQLVSPFQSNPFVSPSSNSAIASHNEGQNEAKKYDIELRKRQVLTLLILVDSLIHFAMYMRP